VRVVRADDRRLRARLERRLLDELQLSLRVGGEAVDAHDDGHAKLGRVLDVLLHVAHALCEERELLRAIRSGQRAAGNDGRAVSMHLEGAHRRDEQDAIGAQARVAAFDVEELLHAHVRAKPRLGHDEAVPAHQLERNLIGDD